MFSHVGFGEVLVLAGLALFLVGPERLPKYAAEAAQLLKQLRMSASRTRADLQAQMGPEIADDLLHPRRFVRRQVQDLLITEDPGEHRSAATTKTQ